MRGFSARPCSGYVPSVRARLLQAVGLALAAAVAGCGGGRPDTIVLIVVDTLRRDHVSSYGGSAAATPNIDALAAAGRRLDHMMASFHQTSMSMAALFTGRTPSIESEDPARPLAWTGTSWCGLERLARDANDTCLPVAVPTLADRLRAAGYYSIGVVSNDLLFNPSGYSRGFDDWVQVNQSDIPPELRGPPPPERLKGARARRAWTGAHGRAGKHVNHKVAAALDRRRPGPLFLYVHFMDAHDYDELGRSYADSVRVADTQVGALMETLRAKGIDPRRMQVVLTADHGERLAETYPLAGLPKHMGNPSWQPVLSVPLIVSPGARGLPQGQLRTEDVFDLVLGLAGLRSERPRDLGPDEVLLTELYYLTYRRGRWKSTQSRDGRAMLLFDLETDAGEQTDVSAAHPDVLSAHRARVASLTRSLGVRPVRDRQLTQEDAERLRSLGYLQ